MKNLIGVNGFKVKFYLILALAVCLLSGCPKKEDDTPPPDACEQVFCENASTCENGTCVCEFPYYGDNCENNRYEDLEGTYFNNLGELGSHFINIEYDSRSRNFSISNFGNLGKTIKGSFLAGENKGSINNFSAPSFFCATESQYIDCGLIVPDDPNTIQIKVNRYEEYCKGVLAKAYYGWTESYQKVDDEICNVIKVEEECKGPGDWLAGKYVFDKELTRTGFYPIIDHTIEVFWFSGSGDILITNLMNSGRIVGLSYKGFNRFMYINNYTSVGVNGWGFTHSLKDYSHAYFTTSGDYLVWETVIRVNYNDGSTRFADAKYVYKRQ